MPLEHYPLRSASVSSGLAFRFYADYEEVAVSSKRSLACHVIVTWRSLAWVLLSLSAAAMVTGAIFSPAWLVGKPTQQSSLPKRSGAALQFSTSSNRNLTSTLVSYQPSVGIFAWCASGRTSNEQCAYYVTQHSSDVTEPFSWKLMTSLFALGALLVVITVAMAIFSLCVLNLCQRSVHTVTGLIQSIAGLVFIIAHITLITSWASYPRVGKTCGNMVGLFQTGSCSIGWAFISCLSGTALLLLCSFLSIKAERSTSCSDVQRQLAKGKACVCCTA